MREPRAKRTDDQRLNRAVVWFLTSLGAWLLWGVYCVASGTSGPHSRPVDLAIVAVDSSGMPVDGALLLDLDVDDPISLLKPEYRGETIVRIMATETRERRLVAAYRDRPMVYEWPNGLYLRRPVLEFVAGLYAAAAESDTELAADPRYDVLVNAGASTQPWSIEWTYLMWLVLLATALWSAIRTVRVSVQVTKRFRRRSKGLCPFCAYSMTDHAGGPCPECGRTDEPQPA